MILPIIAYGDPILKKKGIEIDNSFDGLTSLIENMWQTMYKASGIGLAAPQINQSIRLFIVDTIQTEDEKKKKGFKGIKLVLINPEIIEETGEYWKFEEGCLSIPGVREDVERQSIVKIRFLDEGFNPCEATFDGLNARVIQHEYDHINGILFTDHLKPLKKKLIQKKLNNISIGKVDIDYKMKFPKK